MPWARGAVAGVKVVCDLIRCESEAPPLQPQCRRWAAGGHRGPGGPSGGLPLWPEATMLRTRTTPEEDRWAQSLSVPEPRTREEAPASSQLLVQRSVQRSVHGLSPRPHGSNDCSLSSTRLTGHQVPCQQLRLCHLISSSFCYLRFTGGKNEVPGHVSNKRWRRVGPGGLPPSAPCFSPAAPLVRPQASATAPWWLASSALRNHSTTFGAKP